MTLTVRPLVPADEPRWNEYVMKTEHSHFAARTPWRDLVHATFGCRPDWRFAERDGRVVGVLPLFEKRSGGKVRQLFSAPGGLLADETEVAAALLAPARERVARESLELLELRDQRTRWDDLVTTEEHCTLILELEDDAEAQWKAFDAKLRNQVRKAQKSGLTTRWGRDLLPAWHRVMLHNMRDLGTPFQDRHYFERWLDAYGGDAEIEVTERDGRAIGALALMRHGATGVNPWASSLRAELSRCPNHLLYWEALQRSIVGGARRFDFGRSQWSSRTFDFKKTWGAQPAPLYYQYVLGTIAKPPSLHDQQDTFALAVRVWQHLPLALAGTFGPVVRKRFPEAL
jgi:FemAB-related protein (PEP-CTERM system-associated)